jgi:hypothetical protein
MTMHRRAFLKSIGIALPAVAVANQLPAAAGYQPVQTSEADWQPVADALGRTGTLNGGTVYRVGFPRRDLTVISYGIHVAAGLSLGGYAAFARYRDGQTMAMGDLVVTEPELPAVTDALHGNGIDQSAIHKHLLAHEPDVWWTHLHAIGDATAIAQGVRAALDQTTTPPPAPAEPPPSLDLDTAGIDAALGMPGTNDGGIYKFSFGRNEMVAIHDRVAPTAMGVNTALNFQPVGNLRAAINGDFVMTASEVQNVIVALRAGSIQVVELHNHSLDDQPRLFYLHFWGIDDGVTLAQGLAAAVQATNVHPA